MRSAQTEIAPSFLALSDSDFLLPCEAAKHFRIDERTLEGWRVHKKYGLPYIKVGGAVRYRKSDLDRWIQSRTVNAARAV